MGITALPVLFFVIVAVVLAAVGKSRRHEAQWKAAADQLQLSYEPGRLMSRPKIYGPLADLIISIDITTSSGSTDSTVTRYRVRYPSLDLDLHMSRQTALTRAAAMLGMNDVQTGDAEFDGAFAIKTSDPRRLSAILSADTKRVLLDLIRDYRSTKITDEQVSYEKAGIDRDAGTLVRTTRRLVEVARVLQGRSPEPLRPEREPDLPIRERTSPPLPEMQPDAFKPPPDLEPSTPRPPVRPEPMPEEHRPEPPSPALAGVTAAQVATELFARRGLSFQIARSFEESYQDARIDWPGEVGEVITGTGPNDPTRVTVLVATVEHELFGPVDVRAVASIKDQASRPFTSGSQVRLRGTLTDIDVMGRRLFVEDAQIELTP
jgi:hypothetical protein